VGGYRLVGRFGRLFPFSLAVCLFGFGRGGRRGGGLLLGVGPEEGEDRGMMGEGEVGEVVVVALLSGRETMMEEGCE
jgi:hypothetical protein